MKGMSVFIAGLVVAGALGVGASPAAADTAAGVERGKYWPYARCIAAGARGAAEGLWSRYYCARDAASAFWVLWTDR
ncbi:hypothetical protein AB0K60_36405 [Thermopolyspora sp. NPDC052614]|uniref:hypothetical protein n=1 Tax=Thermopolyspora sp. NPDC052614 TaxID=3155682 RepID=UPI003427E2CF